MDLTGKQKAAMLLMSLDAATATELLKGTAPEMVEELAVEVVALDESGDIKNKDRAKVVKEFCNLLDKNPMQGFSIGNFFGQMLGEIVGQEKAEEIQSQLKNVMVHKDMFSGIRSASVDELVVALRNEHPLTIATILSELSPKKSQEVLSLLDEEVRLKTVLKMTSPESQGMVVKQRMAAMINQQLKALKGTAYVEKPGERQESLRKLAVVLSGLEQELRDQLLEEVFKQDEETGKTVKMLMVTWEDIASIADRSLQESLRSVDSSKLAVALYGADEEIAQKIRANISERAVATLDEETGLMQDPLPKEIREAREEVVEPLRKANEEGELRFIGR